MAQIGTGSGAQASGLAAAAGVAAGLDPGDIGMVSHSFPAVGVLVKGIGTAAASFTLATNGDLTSAFTGTGSPIPAINTTNEWLENSAASSNSDWEARATLTSGTTPTTNAGLNTWLALTSARTWGNTRTNSAGTTTSTLTIDFGEVGTSTSLVTVTNMVISAQLS